MKQQGKLIRWNDSKGFGFVESESFDKNIFIHISALPKVDRNPRVGDIIFFNQVIDKHGKARAEQATIKGLQFTMEAVKVEEVEYEVIEQSDNESKKPGFFLTLMAMASVLYLYQTFAPNPLPIPVPESLIELVQTKGSTKNDFSAFKCQGKQHCSQMTSCSEAKFYLQSCPNVMLDGDNDGVPCERQWCG